MVGGASRIYSQMDVAVRNLALQWLYAVRDVAIAKIYYFRGCRNGPQQQVASAKPDDGCDQGLAILV